MNNYQLSIKNHRFYTAPELWSMVVVSWACLSPVIANVS